MKQLLTIDYLKCDLCGICVELCPDVFEKQNNKIVILKNTVAPHSWTTCSACYANCPQHAIKVANPAKKYKKKKK